MSNKKITLDYLSETRRMKIDLDQLADTVQEMRQTKYTIGSPNMENNIKSNVKKDLSDKIEKSLSIEQSYDKAASEFLDRVSIIQKGISELDLKQQIIIIRYYIKAENMDALAHSLGYSSSACYMFIKKGLKELTK